MSVVIVLTPHGRRHNVKVQPNTALIKVMLRNIDWETGWNVCSQNVLTGSQFNSFARCSRTLVESTSSTQANTIWSITSESLTWPYRFVSPACRTMHNWRWCRHQRNAKTARLSWSCSSPTAAGSTANSGRTKRYTRFCSNCAQMNAVMNI